MPCTSFDTVYSIDHNKQTTKKDIHTFKENNFSVVRYLGVAIVFLTALC